MLSNLFQGIGNYARLYVVALSVLALDQVSKLWILASIPAGTYIYPEPIVVLKHFFYIVHIHNSGAAWGQLSGNNHWLALLAIIALFFIYFFRKHLELYRHGVQYAFGLLIGGIIGNFIDRIYYGYVIDFLDFHLWSYRFPAFNIADCGITIGVAIYILLSFKKTTVKN